LGIIDAPRPIEGQRLETDQPQGAPIGRIMGYRESSSHTPVERAFAQVGIPLWKSGISAKIPEADNRMKKVISKYLNERATELLDSDAWKNSDNETRLKLLRAQIITPAKNDALLELKYSLNPDDRRMEIMYDISKRSGGYSDKQVREALEDIEFDGDITDLDENQLDFLRYTLEENKRDMLLNIKYAV